MRETFQSISFAQLPSELNHYSVGMGIGNENSISNYGLWFCNDYKMYLSKRIAVNPRIGFFQSTGSFESAPVFGYRSNSGFMFECSLSLSIINRARTNLSLNFGSS